MIPSREMLSNLSKAAAKQQRGELASLLAELSERYAQELQEQVSLEDLQQQIERDLGETLPVVMDLATSVEHRGALRALTWGQKVAKIRKSLLQRYQKAGPELLDGSSIYICEACGFIAVAPKAPQRCPICKAPASRIILAG